MTTLALAIVDLQFGSTGKGQIAGTVGRKFKPDTVVTANGPNAGHTYRFLRPVPGFASCTQEVKLIHTVLPVAIVLPTVHTVLIGPGAVIDLPRLVTELMNLLHLGLLSDKRIIIHPNAVILNDAHRQMETPLVGIGSTMKGTAGAAIARILRPTDSKVIARDLTNVIQTAITAIIAEKHQGGFLLSNFQAYVSYEMYAKALDTSQRLLIEGSQGHSLSLYSEFYPYCTSRDISVNQLLMDCAVPRGVKVETIGVARTFPIRVANRFDDKGVQIGTSGPCYGDQQELDWEKDLKRPAELTTVTKLPRRVFSFSYQQLEEALRMNAPTWLALTFCDYLLDPLMNTRNLLNTHLHPAVTDKLTQIGLTCSRGVDFVSFGPGEQDVYSPVQQKFDGPFILEEPSL